MAEIYAISIIIMSHPPLTSYVSARATVAEVVPLGDCLICLADTVVHSAPRGMGMGMGIIAWPRKPESRSKNSRINELRRGMALPAAAEGSMAAAGR